MTAAQRWRDMLAGWAIPSEILRDAPVSPWGFSVRDFADRAERHRRDPTPGHERARQVLADGDRVLDVGCGGGAGSLPLVPPAGALTGVDASPDVVLPSRPEDNADTGSTGQTSDI